MKKLFLSIILVSTMVIGAFAQSPATSAIKHSQDFLVLSLTYDTWTGAPDSIHTGGFSHGLNIAFTYDFKLTDNSPFSVAPGLGISTSHMSFDNQTVDIGGTTSTLNFHPDTAYKNFHLNNTYLEIPVELRYRAISDNANNGFKAAVGLKFGALLDVHSRAVKSVSGYKQTEKVKNKRYFEKWRVAGTFRIGYGNFAAFASYSLTPLLNPNAGAKIRPLSIGIAVSGF